MFMHWLNIKGSLDKETCVCVENISQVTVRRSCESEDKETDSERWYIEAIVGNCILILHSSPLVRLRKDVESDKQKALSYEAKCKKFYKDIVSYVTNESPWETRKILFVPDYSSDKN